MQFVCLVLAIGDDVPIGHFWQSENKVAPHVGEYVFATHRAHCILPTFLLYVPGIQGAHSALANMTAYLPTMQSTHVVCASNPCVDLPTPHSKHLFSNWTPVPLEYLPAIQCTQALFPASTLYFPTAHWTHGPPSFGTVHPALQIHKALSDLGTVFSGQFWHVFVLAPTCTEYWFDMQFVQMPLPESILYFPVAHSAHGLSLV